MALCADFLHVCVCVGGDHPLFLPRGVIEKRDSQPLLRILEEVGGWPVAMDAWNDTVGKARAWAALHRQGALSPGTQGSQLWV